MSLDTAKLEKVRALAGGIVQARCPACAEGGGDRKGEHLRIYPDGRFGCCVNPREREHRKRIFALAGDKTPRGQFQVRVAGRAAITGERSVKGELHGAGGTLGTAKAELAKGGVEVPASPADNLGTLGTDNLNPRAYARAHVGELKDCQSTVPSVPSGERLPYLDRSGGLVIPFNSPERYHYWKPDGKRMSVKETLAEVKQRMAGGKDNHGTEF